MPIVNVFFFPISFLRDEIFFACIAIKRSDSIRSKRKVSSISDRSDISDVPMDHDISGEESPGILSDDQPPESPSDAPDIEEGISTRGMPWLRVYPATDERMCKLLYNIFFENSDFNSLFCCWPILSITNVHINTSATLGASVDRVEPVFEC